MTKQNPTGTPDLHSNFEKLAQFDHAWRTGAAPRIEEFLAPPLATGSPDIKDPARRELLEALVQIDLEYRWRLKPAVGQPWALEEYSRRFPELAPSSQWTLELIGEEYRVRQRWGDRPAHAEFSRRFPQHGNRLPELLARIDAELAQEFSPSPGPVFPMAGTRPSEPIRSVSCLVDALRQAAIFNPTQLAQVETMAAASSEPRTLAAELLRRNWLTAFQVNQILQGNAADLAVGPYLLLERLGEGGAGQVFTARHQKMNRVVALKVIRKDLLADSEAVGRFYREIEIVSRLDHPNVVHAYDAGPAGATHFLAMEYVQGSDLGRMVKQGGPLPVLQACEYIRQAACGLAHAHERGLVHRDIKPHNLIMSLREGRVKLADLGLGRLARPVNTEATAILSGKRSTGTLTPENAGIVGTVDYLAPEQALDFHQADIRADIYSLGCSFYYLLTGQPPFADGNLAQKLARHLNTAPPPVAQFRSDLPTVVSTVLDKMLAKRPEDRYQTPAELAAALGSVPGLPGKLSGTDSRGPSLPRGRWPFRLTAIGLVLILAVGTAGFILSKKTQPPLPSGDSRAAIVKKPTLIIECGRGRRIGPGQGVIAGVTQEEFVAEGYGYKLINGYASDAHFPGTTKPHCWWDYWSLRFEVRVPPGTAGTLRLLFIDGDNKGRKQKLFIGEREIAVIQDFPFPGKPVEVPISAADSKDGKVIVKLANGAGTVGTSVISVIEFTPRPSP